MSVQGKGRRKCVRFSDVSVSQEERGMKKERAKGVKCVWKYTCCYMKDSNGKRKGYKE